MSVPDSVSRRILGFVLNDIGTKDWNQLAKVNTSFRHMSIEERNIRLRYFFEDIFILEEDKMIKKYIHNRDVIFYMIPLYSGAAAYVVCVEPELSVSFAKSFISAGEVYEHIINPDIFVNILLTLIQLEQYELATKFSIKFYNECADDMDNSRSLENTLQLIESGKYEEIDIYYFNIYDNGQSGYLDKYYSDAFMWYISDDVPDDVIGGTLLDPSDGYKKFMVEYSHYPAKFPNQYGVKISLLSRLFISYCKNKESSPVQISIKTVLDICSRYEPRDIMIAIQIVILSVHGDLYWKTGAFAVLFTDRAFNRFKDLVIQLLNIDSNLTYKGEDYRPTYNSDPEYGYTINVRPTYAYSGNMVVSTLLGLSFYHWVDPINNPTEFDQLFNFAIDRCGVSTILLEKIAQTNYSKDEINVIFNIYNRFGFNCDVGPDGDNETDSLSFKEKYFGYALVEDIYKYSRTVVSKIIGKVDLAIDSDIYNRFFIETNPDDQIVLTAFAHGISNFERDLNTGCYTGIYLEGKRDFDSFKEYFWKFGLDE
jgi:hypothetical protein